MPILAAPRRAGQLGGDDARVVDHQQVAWAQQAGQVGDGVIGERSADAQQARGVSRGGGRLGDTLRRKNEVEIRGP